MKRGKGGGAGVGVGCWSGVVGGGDKGAGVAARGRRWAPRRAGMEIRVQEGRSGVGWSGVQEWRRGAARGGAVYGGLWAVYLFVEKVALLVQGQMR